LQLGSILYSGDNNDFIPGNYPLDFGGYLPAGQTSFKLTPASGYPSWVAGSMGAALNGVADGPAGCSTNAYFLGVFGDSIPGIGTVVGSIGTYAKAAGSYKCPADQTIDTHWHMPRVRSVSANMYVGMSATELTVFKANGGNMYNIDVRFKIFTKTSDFSARLSPSDCFNFLDENPATLNDGYFEYIAAGNSIGDRPAINHGASSSFSFCDGHAALHKWQDTYLNINNTTVGQDVKWLATHGTALNN
jgi:prepilin-type processing-associated H-X9-DG protein